MDDTKTLQSFQEKFSRKYQDLSDEIKSFFDSQGVDLAQSVSGKAIYQCVTNLEVSHMWLVNGLGALAMAGAMAEEAVEAKAQELEAL